jgi:hypothetical protein
MYRYAGRLPHRHQTGHDGIRPTVDERHDLAVHVAGDAAHVVVHGRQYGNGLAGHVDTGEDARGFGDPRQPLPDDLVAQVLEVQVNVVPMLADTAALVDLDRHRPGHDVARGEILRVRSIALHESLAGRVREVAAFAARALGDQAARAVYPGRMKLNELHVLQRQPGAQHHAAAVAGTGVRRGTGEIRTAVATGCEDRRLRAETVQRAVGHVERDYPAAGAILHDQVDREVLDEEPRLVLERLLIERVQHRVPGAVGGRAGSLRGALAVVRRHAAERTLVDAAVLGARERHAVVLELDHG